MTDFSIPAADAERAVRARKRRELREILRPYGTSSYFTGLGLAGLDLALFVSLSTLVVALPNVPGKLLSSIALALIMSRLFVLGHDAGHHSLTPSRRINTILARILFLPTYSCFSLWQAGHNVAHHGFAGLKGRDIPWVPLSPDEYISRPRMSRWLYRVYRSWWGAGVYYGLDSVGARIWALLAEPRSVAELVTTIVDEFDVTPERCERDLLALLDDLAARGLVREQPAGA